MLAIPVRTRIAALVAMAASLLLTATASPAAPQPAASLPSNDIPVRFLRPTDHDDYVKRVVMIPMRDGVRLCTVIVIPKGAKDAPIILTRTPYNARERAGLDNPSVQATLSETDWDFAANNYIRVFQDIRGKYGSEGAYLMTRHPRGPFNTTKTDDSTDAWDTIDWLVKHVPESNGRVGMMGSSYEGWTVVMALLDPHPALKAAVPESPMVDGWMGDDWYHYGAFRLNSFDYFAEQTEVRGLAPPVPRTAYDDYEGFLAAGSAADYATAHGLDQLPWWRTMLAHPSYDAFWQAQALDKLVAAHPSNVPTLWEQGLWDQEDMWGANHSWRALQAAGHEANNWLVIGPWYHSQANHFGWNLGPLRWPGDTALQFRRDMILKFFNQYLKNGPAANLPRVSVYSPAQSRWEGFQDWPVACDHGCAHGMTPLYLRNGAALSFDKPATDGSDSYVSDPARPVPFLPRPVRLLDEAAWQTWLVHDQRFVDGRPDVLTYQTQVLTHPVKIQGAPLADIIASTTGTDGDVVVKLIDVYPSQYPPQPQMGGYELPVALDIFRGRYRNSFEHPEAIPPGAPQHYRFTLPNQNYVFLPGHRIMVQIQSTLFPLYDRNPQTFVNNPLTAGPGDYRKATITVLHSPSQASAVWLPLVPSGDLR